MNKGLQEEIETFHKTKRNKERLKTPRQQLTSEQSAKLRQIRLNKINKPKKPRITNPDRPTFIQPENTRLPRLPIIVDDKPTIIICINLHSNIILLPNHEETNPENILQPIILSVPSDKELYTSFLSEPGNLCRICGDEHFYLNIISPCKTKQKSRIMCFNENLYNLYKQIYNYHSSIEDEYHFEGKPFTQLSSFIKLNNYFEKKFMVSRTDSKQKLSETELQLCQNLGLYLYDTVNVNEHTVRGIKKFIYDLMKNNERNYFMKSELINFLISVGIERIFLFDLGCNDFMINGDTEQTEEQKQHNYELIKELSRERNIRGGKYKTKNKKIKKNKKTKKTKKTKKI
jgi:hypothetical protein